MHRFKNIYFIVTNMQSPQRERYNSVTEVVDYLKHPAIWHLRHRRGREFYTPDAALSQLYHDLFSRACDKTDKHVAGMMISGNYNPATIKHLGHTLKSSYRALNAPSPPLMTPDQYKIERDIFSGLKAKFESERMWEMWRNSRDWKNVMDETYLHAVLLDGSKQRLVSEQHKVIGVPDKIEFRGSEAIPVEMKPVKTGNIILPEYVNQSKGYILLSDEDEGVLGKQFFSERGFLYPIEDCCYHELRPASLNDFIRASDELHELKRSTKTTPDYDPATLPSDSLYFARLSPSHVEAIEYKGRWMVRRDPVSGAYVEPGQVDTIGLESLVSKAAIDAGNTKLEQARAMEKFEPIRLWAYRQLGSLPGDLEDKLVAMESTANDYSTLRLLNVLEFGVPNTQMTPAITVAKKLDMSETSARTCLELGVLLGWIYRKKETEDDSRVKSPFTGRPIETYRRKKKHEMTEREWNSYNGFRQEQIGLLRQCGTPLTTFYKQVFEHNLPELEFEWMGIKRQGINKGGGRRRFFYPKKD
jgi:hypothetical protein